MARAKRLKGTIEDFLLHAPIVSRAFFALCNNPYGLTAKQLAYEIYYGNEPAWAINSMHVSFMYFNRKSAKNRWGLRIRGSGGPGSKYQIWVVREFPLVPKAGLKRPCESARIKGAEVPLANGA